MISHRFILLVAVTLFAFATSESDNNDSYLFSYLRRQLKKPRNPKAAPKPDNAQGPKPKKNTPQGPFIRECYKLENEGDCESTSDTLGCKWCNPGDKCIPASFGCCKHAKTENDCDAFDLAGEGCDWVENECEAKDCDEILVEADCTAVSERCIWDDADEPKCSRNKQLVIAP